MARREGGGVGEGGLACALPSGKKSREKRPFLHVFLWSKRQLFLRSVNIYRETSLFRSQSRDDAPGMLSSWDSILFLNRDVEDEWFEKNHSPSYLALKIESAFANSKWIWFHLKFANRCCAAVLNISHSTQCQLPMTSSFGDGNRIPVVLRVSSGMSQIRKITRLDLPGNIFDTVVVNSWSFWKLNKGLPSWFHFEGREPLLSWMIASAQKLTHEHNR